VRVVCQNTLNWALARAQQRYSIRHTDKIREHVHQARRVLELSIDYYQQFKHTGDQLASERITEAQLRRVLDELYPSGTEDVATERTRRSRERTKQRIVELFLHGDTQGNAPRSKWAAVNAVIEYADYLKRPVIRG
jgi:calcineurin-like phosphoesterase family protein